MPSKQKLVTIMSIPGFLLGNTAQAELSIENIDCFAPEVTHTLTPSKETCDTVTVIIDATDPGFGGSEGVGLDDECYSWDGGNSWSDNNTYETDENGDGWITGSL